MIERSLWHPVALSHAVGSQPQGASLLGEDLVLWRDAAGADAGVSIFGATGVVANGVSLGSEMLLDGFMVSGNVGVSTTGCAPLKKK